MTKKLRIAQIVSMYESVPPKSQNGLEFVVSWLTEELVRRGHDVTLFAPANSKTKAKLVSIIPERISAKNSEPWHNFFFSIWNTIIAGTKKDEFDIIHCHNSNSTYIAPFVSVPVVETIHSPFNDNVTKLCHNNEYVRSLQPIFDEYSKVNYVAVSKHQENDFATEENIYFKKHTCIHNGIPVENFTFSDNSDGQKDYLLFIGYINKNKGADVAVRVARALNMKLILAGSTFGEEEFFEEHIKPFLDEKIVYVGTVDFEQKNKLYGGAIAKLAPVAWHEPFGLTLVEAQACGTPVIAFDKGAAREVVNDGVTGFVVNSETEMIDAVKKISEIDRKNCRAWVEENFSVKKMVDEYEKLYNKLASEK